MVNDVKTTGWKSKIFGYISKGDRVPDVMTTLWNRSNTGLMAMEQSRHVKWRIGFETVGVLSSNGSTIMVNPLVYVATNVASWVILVKALKSVILEISRVRKSEASLSAQNRRGFRSIHTFWKTSFRKLAGDSWTTYWTLRRVLMYSTNLLRKPTKCSAVRMLPGTTSGISKMKIFI